MKSFNARAAYHAHDAINFSMAKQSQIISFEQNESNYEVVRVSNQT